MILEMLYAGGVAWMLARAVRQYGSFKKMEKDTMLGNCRASVTVIVPARNEEGDIGACVASLAEQEYGSGALEMVVVDDQSTDGTAREAAARGMGRVAVIRAPTLPAGWTGKSHACWEGAAPAWTDYLCFMDADVRANRQLLRKAVAYAESHGIDMLSLEPFQEMGTCWERLIMPAGFLLLGATQDLRAVNDPGRSQATANGQFILIRRGVYRVVGGHAAVREAVAEDSALAERVKRAGYRVALLDGGELLRARMYRSLGDLWEGLSKNIPQMLHGVLPAAGAALLGFTLAAASVALPIVAAVAYARAPGPWRLASLAAASAGTLALLLTHVGMARHFRIPLGYALLYPAGYVLGAALVVTSIVRRWRGRIRWKGRTYRAGEAGGKAKRRDGT